MTRIVGLVSDTHGLLRPEALDALRGSDLIVHCGDVGDPAVLEGLAAIAPVRAVRGNNDKGRWAANLPTCDVVEVADHSIYVIHDLSELDVDPAAAGFSAVVSGHSHKPIVERRGEVLFVNPGSAGPRRFQLPIAVARLVLSRRLCEATILHIAA
jgi:uncharacterized protein